MFQKQLTNFIILIIVLIINGYKISAKNFNNSINKIENVTNQEDIVIGFLAGYGSARLVLGALPLAVEIINQDPNLLPGRKMLFKAADIGWRPGPYRTLPIRLMTEMREGNALAFIGPDEGCTFEALVAAAWNMPMISYNCADTAVSNKSYFHTFARMLAPASKISKSVIALLSAFDWKKFTLIAGTRIEWAAEVAQAIRDLAFQEKLTIMHFREISDYIPTNTNPMQKIVDDTFETTRIYVFIGEHFAMIDLVRCLERHKLLETGEYIVISVDDKVYDPTHRSSIVEREYLDPFLNDAEKIDIQSFQSVLKISTTHSVNKNFRKICDKIKDFSRKPPFLVPYHEKVFNTLDVPIYGAHLFDAVNIYARAVTEILEIGGDIRDGRLVMSHIYNRSYRSIQGFDVYIDANGDAEGNYTVIALQDDNLLTTNTTVKMSMQPIGYFLYNTQGSLPEFKYLRAKRQIRWRKGYPPPDEPPCGFHGELCKLKNLDWRYLTSGTCLALFLIVAGAFLIKHYRYEQTLACLLWKIDMKDITLINVESLDNGTRKKSLVQTCRPSLTTYGETTKRAYTTIGAYRGNIVAIKKIYKKSIDITRSIRKELKQMRELRHENIINFVGASVDHGMIAIVTTYCARGSLEDVLANEDLYLDNMFISSLVSDILKGMIYIHDSDIVSHGNLKSSNCLVDSRWICQIADFGLHEFKAGQEEPNKRELEVKRSLWRAPEILRVRLPPNRGTQKGDVYSFGIVLYEIVGRKGPWGEVSCSNDEIIKRVKSPEKYDYIIFRPSSSHLDIPDYVKQCLLACWEEDPEIRPDMRLVRVKLKPMQAGLKPNIFDNMLSIMEKYAYNLEGLVQERTNLLFEEKKKTETLLLRMLPKSVAESLKRGEPVEAECFEWVTIFFSDLVGFTELCARSTPFEVVEMLNDLYTCCDSIISNYDVYKVETIGDAYMVVSGLPIRNGNKHAGEIASLALHLLEHVSKLEIRHRPGEYLQFRIGIHSGQCVAGVVGLKMPRYCLFGDTVNTAARMESTGEPLKIHISETTYELLRNVGGYHCLERGLTLIKGKGEMKTYWLISEDPIKRTERLSMSVDLHVNDVAPDLICNADIENVSSTNQPNEETAFRTLTSSRLPLANITSFSEQNINKGKITDEYDNEMLTTCIPKRNLPNTRWRSVKITPFSGESDNRGPHSAPHISFMK